MLNQHKAGIEASTSTHNIQRVFRGMTSSEDLQTLAKEGAFAFHTARYKISFKSNDCTSSLINKSHSGTRFLSLHSALQGYASQAMRHIFSAG